MSVQWKDILNTIQEDENSDDDDFDDEFSDLEDDIAPSSSNAPGIVNTSNKGRKKEEEDTKELKSLKTGEFFDSLKPNSNPTPQLQQSEFVISKGIQWEAPKQVVKRITRKIKPDGSETIEVRFIVSEVEVSRVLSKMDSQQTTNTKKKNSQQNHLNETEDLFEDEKSEAHALKLNIGKMKNKVALLS